MVCPFTRSENVKNLAGGNIFVARAMLNTWALCADRGCDRADGVDDIECPCEPMPSMRGQ